MVKGKISLPRLSTASLCMTTMARGGKGKKGSPPPTPNEKKIQHGHQRNVSTSREPTDENSVSGKSHMSKDSSSTNTNHPVLLASNQTMPKTRAFLPIMLSVEHWQTSDELVLSKISGAKIFEKLVNNQIKITSDSESSYCNIKRILSDNKTPFHTFALPDQESLKVLLRGIPSSFSEQSFKDVLTNQGFSVTHIRKFLKDERKLPMFMVTLSSLP